MGDFQSVLENQNTLLQISVSQSVVSFGERFFVLKHVKDTAF
jgi:hypothetical protein